MNCAPSCLTPFNATLASWRQRHRGIQHFAWSGRPRLVPFENPNGSEHWQIISPVRMHPHGVYDLNRWVQRQFRARELEAAANPWGISLGDENIVSKDKVIQTSNQWRKAYDGQDSDKHYLANGEVGLVATGKNGWLNVLFAGRPGLRFGYSGRDFPGGPVLLNWHTRLRFINHRAASSGRYSSFSLRTAGFYRASYSTRHSRVLVNSWCC